MRHCVCLRLLVLLCALAGALCVLTPAVSAKVNFAEEAQEPTEAATAPTEDTTDEELLGAVEELPDQISDSLINGVLNMPEEDRNLLTNFIMDGWLEWGYSSLLTAAETAFACITVSSTDIFDYPWFSAIVGLFSRFGTLLFGVGVVLAVVDIGVEYRRRGADLTTALLNLGKGMFAVGLFATVPVPLFVFCVSIQHRLLNAFATGWSFQNIQDAITAQAGAAVWIVIMLIIMLVLMIIVCLGSLKRGGLLLVQICIGSLHMLSVPRGYLDNFYGWCKQVIGLCITVLLQNILMFCGLMLIPTYLPLGIGVMCAAKDVPRICAQFGLDTSAKANLTRAAMGANAAMQAVKAGVALFA